MNEMIVRPCGIDEGDGSHHGCGGSIQPCPDATLLPLLSLLRHCELQQLHILAQGINLALLFLQSSLQHPNVLILLAIAVLQLLNFRPQLRCFSLLSIQRFQN
ncbi:hypothetical protein EJB05_01336, partial [Eragrostis curvula]